MVTDAARLSLSNASRPYQSSKGAPWVGSSWNLFLHSTRSLENLSSGENLAGWALCVGDPSGAVFCATHPYLIQLANSSSGLISYGCFRNETHSSAYDLGVGHSTFICQGKMLQPYNSCGIKVLQCAAHRSLLQGYAHLQGVYTLARIIQVVHEVHDVSSL